MQAIETYCGKNVLNYCSATIEKKKKKPRCNLQQKKASVFLFYFSLFSPPSPAQIHHHTLYYII
jgi:hypothetical protein